MQPKETLFCDSIILSWMDLYHVDYSVHSHQYSCAVTLTDTIFVRVFESRMDLLTAVIIGAEGTPYHNGLFFFDVFFPSAYPSVPPVSFPLPTHETMKYRKSKCVITQFLFFSFGSTFITIRVGFE